LNPDDFGMKRALFLLLFISMLASSSFAFKVRDLPFASDVHLGVATGVGAGVNFGFDAAFQLADITIGPEIEQLVLDVDYSSAVNATRYGGYVGISILEHLSINYHLGKFNFQVKDRDIRYNANGVNYLLTAGTNSYAGVYQAVSLDYLWGDFLISPKVVFNSIDDQATLREFDLNIGARF